MSRNSPWRPAIVRGLYFLVIAAPFVIGLVPILSGPGQATAASDPDIAKLLEATSLAFESAARVVSPAVVYLEARVESDDETVVHRETGSGILLRKKDYPRAVIVTNHHVVGDAKLSHIDIYLADGRLLHPDRVLSDEETDLSILEIYRDDLPAARLDDQPKLHIGQWVLAIGSPFGLSQSVTHGIISATDRRQIGLPRSMRMKEFLQTDAAINPGNSGGPLVNLKGDVIGINTAIASRTGSSSGVGFAVPSRIVRWVLNELLVHGRVRRGYLGVEFPNDFSHEKAEEIGLDSLRGAYVAAVHAGTPADRVGIQVGDCILEIDGRLIQDENHLINIVSQSGIGQTVTLKIWRQGKEHAIRVALGDWDDFKNLIVPAK